MLKNGLWKSVGQMAGLIGDEPGRQGLFLAYLAALAAGLWLLNHARRSFWLVSVLALPGTLAHELCHWALGTAMNGRPVRFTVLPRREGRGYVLGAVAFSNLRWYNAFFIGMAPLLLLPAAFVLFQWRLAAHPALGWSEALMAFLIANLLFGAVPSWADLRIAARSPVGWALLVLALGWGWLRWRSSPTVLIGLYCGIVKEPPCPSYRPSCWCSVWEGKLILPPCQNRW